MRPSAAALLAPRQLLRLEGLAGFVVATAAFVVLDGPWWLFVGLALAPDLAMFGYLIGPRIGSGLYNAVHTSVVPLALTATGLWLATPVVTWIGLVWLAHIGLDRAIGYGLKYPTSFGDTHLSWLRSRAAGIGPMGESETKAPFLSATVAADGDDQTQAETEL